MSSVTSIGLLDSIFLWPFAFIQPQKHVDLNLSAWGHVQDLKCAWILCWFLLQKWILAEKSYRVISMWQWERKEMTALISVCAQLQAVNMWLQIPYELIWTVFTKTMWLFISKPTLIHSCHFFIIKTFYLAFSVYNRVSALRRCWGRTPGGLLLKSKQWIWVTRIPLSPTSCYFMWFLCSR